MIAEQWEPGSGGVREGLQKGLGKLLGVKDLFTTLTVVVVSQGQPYVKIDEIVQSKHMQFRVCRLKPLQILL